MSKSKQSHTNKEKLLYHGIKSATRTADDNDYKKSAEIAKSVSESYLGESYSEKETVIGVNIVTIDDIHSFDDFNNTDVALHKNLKEALQKITSENHKEGAMQALGAAMVHLYDADLPELIEVPENLTPDMVHWSPEDDEDADIVTLARWFRSRQISSTDESQIRRYNKNISTLNEDKLDTNIREETGIRDVEIRGDKVWIRTEIYAKNGTPPALKRVLENRKARIIGVNYESKAGTSNPRPFSFLLDTDI